MKRLRDENTRRLPRPRNEQRTSAKNHGQLREDETRGGETEKKFMSLAVARACAAASLVSLSAVFLHREMALHLKNLYGSPSKTARADA